MAGALLKQLVVLVTVVTRQAGRAATHFNDTANNKITEAPLLINQPWLDSKLKSLTILYNFSARFLGN